MGLYQWLFQCPTQVYLHYFAGLEQCSQKILGLKSTTELQEDQTLALELKKPFRETKHLQETKEDGLPSTNYARVTWQDDIVYFVSDFDLPIILRMLRLP